MTDATTTLTPTVYTVPETVPEVAPMPYRRGRVFITRLAEAENDHYVGRVVEASGAPSANGYITELPSGDSIRVYGQPVNPEPVNGKVYRMLGPEGLGHLVRYNDEAHTGDRNSVGHPYSILAGPDGVWPYPNDSASPSAIEASHLIEVEYEVSDVRQPETAEPPAVAEPETAAPDIFKGLAVTVDDAVVLNPAPVEGVTYIVSYDAGSGAMFQMGMFTDGQMIGRGSFTVGDDGAIQLASRYGDTWTLDSNPDIKWAAMKMLTPEHEGEEDRTTITGRLTTQYASLVSNFESFNEALNQKADDCDWCSEYEGIIEPLGMTGRNKDKDWVVEVVADVTITDSNPSSSMDQRLRAEWGEDSFTASNMEVTGTVTVYINVDECSEDSARDYVDSDTVESELENMFSGCSVEVTDYRIDDVTERD